jgi:hypothetical protein
LRDPRGSLALVRHQGFLTSPARWVGAQLRWCWCGIRWVGITCASYTLSPCLDTTPNRGDGLVASGAFGLPDIPRKMGWVTCTSRLLSFRLSRRVGFSYFRLRRLLSPRRMGLRCGWCSYMSRWCLGEVVLFNAIIYRLLLVLPLKGGGLRLILRLWPLLRRWKFELVPLYKSSA